MSRKLERKRARRDAAEELRRQRRKASRRSNLVTVAIASVIVALVAVLVYTERRDAASTGSANFGVGERAARCSGARELESLGADHVADGTNVPRDQYNSFPPTSGPHWQTPAPTGFHEDAVSPSQLIHNLEHGQIVIYYQDLSPDEQAALEDYVDDAQPAVIAAPMPEGSDDFKVALTAWTVLETCKELSGQAIVEFRRAFQGRAPEKLVPPFDG